MREQAHRLLARKISDSAAQERDECWAGDGRERKRLGDVGDHRYDLHIDVVCAQLDRSRLQKLLADIDRHVALGAAAGAHLIENYARLRRTPRAQLDERTRPHNGNDLGNPLFEK